MVSFADELPTTIEAGAVVKLTANISLEAGQQIETVAGTLDGQGHSIVLNGKALAKSVAGTVQNLGVTGSMTISGTDGPIATTCSGTVQMCWSTASPSDDNWTFADAAGLVGKLDGGSVLNSYYAGSLSGMPFGGYGLVAWYQSGTVTNNLFTAGDQRAATRSILPLAAKSLSTTSRPRPRSISSTPMPLPPALPGLRRAVCLC